MWFAAIVFGLSLAGIAGLFALKHWEEKRERVLAPEWRMRADERAEHLKELATAARIDLSKLPSYLLVIGRYLVHEAALIFAALARTSERQAYRLADMVSYKHRFEQRKTRSEFLRKVAERKNGSADMSGNTADEPDGGAI